MPAYYNENDPFAAQWLRNLIAKDLIAPGFVDERDIREVQPTDLKSYIQHHFFAGIGGWSYALRLAGWNDKRPVWTGSCPCQPFSSAARGRTTRREDVRHLWPIWKRLIAASTPRTIFGEQVPQAGDWFDEVYTDLEELDYSIGAAILPAVSVGQDHARSRLYFVGHSDSYRKSGRYINAETPGMQRTRGLSENMVSQDGLSGRMAKLRGFGNSIVPQVAATFIQAYLTRDRE